MSRLSFAEVVRDMAGLFSFAIVEGPLTTSAWYDVSAAWQQEIVANPQTCRTHLAGALADITGATWVEGQDTPIFPERPPPISQLAFAAAVPPSADVEIPPGYVQRRVRFYNELAAAAR